MGQIKSLKQIFSKLIGQFDLQGKGASTPSNIASNIAGNSFHLTSGVQGGDIAGN